MSETADDRDRLRALTDLAVTLLVEAAAGTGKTSLLAGRVIFLLASNLPPSEIAAITFTELAAGELRARISRYLDELLAGNIPEELERALPRGLSLPQREALENARLRLDQSMARPTFISQNACANSAAGSTRSRARIRRTRM
jgi:CRISPR-associated exonuclease Cas4